MSFAVLFDFAHQKRVLEAALRAGNIYRFVFKHIRTSQRSYKILRRLAIQQDRVLQGTSNPRQPPNRAYQLNIRIRACTRRYEARLKRSEAFAMKQIPLREHPTSVGLNSADSS
jgi:hypothetical protein